MVESRRQKGNAFEIWGGNSFKPGILYKANLLSEVKVQERHFYYVRGFPGGTSGKEPTCQCRRHKRRKLDPWVGTIPWKRAWQPTPVYVPGEFHEQRSLVGLDYSVVGSQRVRHD